MRAMRLVANQAGVSVVARGVHHDEAGDDEEEIDAARRQVEIAAAERISRMQEADQAVIGHDRVGGERAQVLDVVQHAGGFLSLEHGPTVIDAGTLPSAAPGERALMRFGGGGLDRRGSSVLGIIEKARAARKSPSSKVICLGVCSFARAAGLRLTCTASRGSSCSSASMAEALKAKIQIGLPTSSLAAITLPAHSMRETERGAAASLALAPESEPSQGSGSFSGSRKTSCAEAGVTPMARHGDDEARLVGLARHAAQAEHQAADALSVWLTAQRSCSERDAPHMEWVAGYSR